MPLMVLFACMRKASLVGQSSVKARLLRCKEAVLPKHLFCGLFALELELRRVVAVVAAVDVYADVLHKLLNVGHCIVVGILFLCTSQQDRW